MRLTEPEPLGLIVLEPVSHRMAIPLNVVQVAMTTGTASIIWLRTRKVWL